MTTFNLLDWRVFNALSPFIGLMACSYVLFSHKTSTHRKAVSSAVSLAALMWLMLIWADWGSMVFHASYQTMISRVMLLIASSLIMYELRFYTRTNRLISISNMELSRENAHLHWQVEQLKMQSSIQEETIP